jgi:flagellar biosynthetic protein FliP
MGFLILLPFLVVDLVVASVLSALGMVMLPPSVVALPVKLLVFVAVDGWHLVVRALLAGAA